MRSSIAGTIIDNPMSLRTGDYVRIARINLRRAIWTRPKAADLARLTGASHSFWRGITDLLGMLYARARRVVECPGGGSCAMATEESVGNRRGHAAAFWHLDCACSNAPGAGRWTKRRVNNVLATVDLHPSSQNSCSVVLKRDWSVQTGW